MPSPTDHGKHVAQEMSKRVCYARQLRLLKGITTMVTTVDRPSSSTGAAVTYGRALKGWRQDELAERLTESTGRTWDKRRVSRVEKGDYEPRGTEVVALAEVLDLTVEFLLYGLTRPFSTHTGWFGGWPSDLHVHPDAVAA